MNTSGSVVERYAYDPYGAMTVLNPDFSVRGTSSYNWNYFFQGKRYDGAVGLYDSRARVYSPTLMRWLQTDPLGLGPDNNDYRMETNGPTGTVDPSGLAPPNDREREQMVKRKNEIAQRLAFLERDAARFVKNIESQGKNASEDDRKLAAQYKAELAALRAEYDALSKELGSEAGEQQEALERLRRRAQADWAITSTYAEQNIAWTRSEREARRQFLVNLGITLFSGIAAEAVGALGAGRAAALTKAPCPPAGAPKSGVPIGIGQRAVGKAPYQVRPGVRVLEGTYIDDLGRIQPWRAHYDEFGRLIARTDYNAGNAAAGIPDVHHHTYRWGPGMNPLETGSHLPGEYVP